MKYKKILIILFIILTITLLLFFYKKSSSGLNKDIIGTWEVTSLNVNGKEINELEYSKMTYNKDKSFKGDTKYQNQETILRSSGKYKIEDGNLISYNHIVNEKPYKQTKEKISISGNVLSLNDKESTTKTIFKKI